MRLLQITESEQLLELDDNEFVGEIPKLTNSQINFNGKNNILVCEEDVNIINSRIDFNLDNSILYLSSSNHDYALNISIHNNNICFIGKNNYFNGLTTIVLSESKNVIIGNDCLFSYNITIRTADGHLVYNSNTKERLNHSKSVYIGDHVWLGQNSMILKGTQIGSGSTIGANSVLSNKIIPSNTTFAGNPVKLIYEATFWTGHSVHGWGNEETQKMSKYEADIFVYCEDENTLEFSDIENELNGFSDIDDILPYIVSNLLFSEKNRFFIKNK